MKHVFIFVYDPTNMKTAKRNNEKGIFWKELHECMKEFGEGRMVLVKRDMNAEVSDESMDEVVGKMGSTW